MALRRTFLLKRCFQTVLPASGGVQRFHTSIDPTPEVPLSLHDPDSFFIVPEDGSPLKFFEPEIPDLNLDTLEKIGQDTGENLMKIRTRIFQRAAEVDLVLISNQAIQTAKKMPSRINKYFISYDGVISGEKIVPIEKIKTNVRDAASKLTELTDKLPTSGIQEKWEVVKGKMPVWQNTIAMKLQDIQDSINKRLNPKKSE